MVVMVAVAVAVAVAAAAAATATAASSSWLPKLDNQFALLVTSYSSTLKLFCALVSARYSNR